MSFISGQNSVLSSVVTTSAGALRPSSGGSNDQFAKMIQPVEQKPQATQETYKQPEQPKKTPDTQHQNKNTDPTKEEALEGQDTFNPIQEQDAVLDLGPVGVAHPVEDILGLPILTTDVPVIIVSDADPEPQALPIVSEADADPQALPIIEIVDNVVNSLETEHNISTNNLPDGFIQTDNALTATVTEPSAASKEVEEPEAVATVAPTVNIVVQEFAAVGSNEAKAILPEEKDVVTPVITTETADVIETEVETAPELSHKDTIFTPKQAPAKPVTLKAVESQATKTENNEQKQDIKLPLNTELAEAQQENIETQPKVQAPVVDTTNKLPPEVSKTVKSIEVISAPAEPQVASKNPDDMNFGQNLSGENDGKNSPPKTDADFITSIFDNEVLTARTDVASINRVTGEPIKTAEFILDQLSKPIADSTKNLVSVNEDRVLIIKLNPESLGTVTAKLERGPEGLLKVTLTVDKQETYDIIRATQKEIIAALEKVTEGDNTSFSFNLAKGNQGQAGYENDQNRFHGNNELDTYTLKPREDTYSNNAALVYNNNDSVNIIL